MDKQVFIGLIIVGFLSLVVRGAYLGSINQVVFDEVHFGKFISSYCCTHERFFDIHPPVGKLLIAFGAYAAGYDGQFPFEHIGQEYSHIPIAAIRAVPAIVGSLLPVIIAILLLQVGTSKPIALLGGIAAAFENALIVESRFILTDSMLLVGIFGALAASIASVQAISSRRSWIWACIAGVFAGVAIGTKFTGSVGGGLAVCVYLFHIIRMGGKGAGMWMGKIAVMAMVAASIYLLSWVAHFSLLTQPGSGDVWGIPTGNFWQDVAKVHEQMLSANYHLTAGHPYGSKWYTWPFMVRSVFYWQSGTDQFVYLLGNPAVWWGSAFLCVLGVLYSFSSVIRGVHIKRNPMGWIFLVGYFASFVPLMRVPRVLFLYHYLTPLLFSLLLGLWWLDGMVRRSTMRIVIVGIVIVLIGFLFIFPLTYGTAISPGWQQVLFAISSWR